MKTWKILYVLVNIFIFTHVVSACPNIISKAEWGGRNTTATIPRIGDNLPYVVIHHGATKTYCYNKEECSKIVWIYQKHHIDNNKWADIGYTFLVGEDGNVYEGRGWNSFGAHVPSFNRKSIGICLIGDFTARVPNQKALNAVKSLIQCAVAKRKISQDYMLIGHRQSSSGATTCPGNSLYAEIKTWPHWTARP